MNDLSGSTPDVVAVEVRVIDVPPLALRAPTFIAGGRSVEYSSTSKCAGPRGTALFLKVEEAHAHVGVFVVVANVRERRRAVDAAWRAVPVRWLTSVASACVSIRCRRTSR
jgi:hypothetical protein